MPLYEFECGNCRKEFELLVPSAKWKGAVCPHCGSNKLSKKLSVFASHVAATGQSAAPPPVCPSTGRACGCCGPTHRH